MKVQRTIPPAAAPLQLADLVRGFAGFFAGRRPIERLEEEMRDYWGVKHVFLVSSGKAALAIILMALRSLSAKREVIIPAYTCFSVPSAVAKARLNPSLCDLDPTTFDFDRRKLEETISEQTLCVVPNHLFGIPADMDRIISLCKARGAYVVEDAAQAMGGTYQGRKIGTLGDVGFFSWGRGKNVTCGSGGAIITNSDAIGEAVGSLYAALERPGPIEAIADFLQAVFMTVFVRPTLYWIPAGLPFLKLGETFYSQDFPIRKLSRVKAALLKSWRLRLERSNLERAETGAYYQRQVRSTAEPPSDPSLPYLRFPVITTSREERDRLYAQSRAQGLGLSVMYPTSINRIDAIHERFARKSFPVAEAIAERLLALPTHGYVSSRDRSRIGELLMGSTLLS